MFCERGEWSFLDRVPFSGCRDDALRRGCGWQCEDRADWTENRCSGDHGAEGYGGVDFECLGIDTWGEQVVLELLVRDHEEERPECFAG